MAKASSSRRLNDLQICLGTSAPHFTQQKFRRETAHIGLIVLRHLRDECRYLLDGSELLFVYFGMPESQREQFGTANYYRVPQGNWSACCVPRFDLKSFAALAEADQDKRTAKLLETALRTAAREAGADEKPIRAALRRVRDGNFTGRFPIPQLTVADPAGKRTATVWSHISRGQVRWLIEVVDAGGELIHSQFVPEECYRNPEFTETLVRATWDRRGFALRNDKGRAWWTLPDVASGGPRG